MRFPVLGRLEDAETGEVLIERLLVANTFLQRLRGLQFAPPLDSDSGLLLRNCRSVHTMWMRFSIDVVFLSNEFDVIEVRPNARPWRVIVPKAKQTVHVLEVIAGRQDTLRVGRKTRIIATVNAPT